MSGKESPAHGAAGRPRKCRALGARARLPCLQDLDEERIMRYTHSLPPLPSFDGKGLFGYTFGPLQQKDLEIYYIESEKGHDTFVVSNRITRVYYVLCGSGYFTINDHRYDVSHGML